MKPGTTDNFPNIRSRRHPKVWANAVKASLPAIRAGKEAFTDIGPCYLAVVAVELRFGVVDFAAAVLAVLLVPALTVFAVVEAGFRAGAFRFGAGPFARFSASSSDARSAVSDSISSPFRSVALYSPSVTYGPNRPSFTTIGFFDTGSSPSSLSGGFAVADRPRCFGSA